MNESNVERLLERAVRLLEQIAGQGGKPWYTVAEFAALVGKEPETIRVHCWRGRLNSERAMTGCGCATEYRLSHEELERFRREGLLPRRAS